MGDEHPAHSVFKAALCQAHSVVYIADVVFQALCEPACKVNVPKCVAVMQVKEMWFQRRSHQTTQLLRF